MVVSLANAVVGGRTLTARLGDVERRPITPLDAQFGALGNGVADDGAALVAFFAYCEANDVGVANVAGNFRTSVPITYGLSATPKTKTFVGKFKLTATAAMDEVFTITSDADYIDWQSIDITGTGSTNTYSSRTCNVGLFIEDAARVKFGRIHANSFAFGGLVVDSAGSFNSSLSHFGFMKFSDCGSGAAYNGRTYGAGTAWSGVVNSGDAGNLNQSAQVTVTDLPPSVITSGTYGGAPPNAPIFLRICNRLHQITAINTDTKVVSLRVWVDLDFAKWLDTSTSSVAIGSASGTRTFTVTAGKAWVAETPIKVYSAADPTKYMVGYVNSYSGTTLVMTVQQVSGSGTFTDWVIGEYASYVFGGGLYLDGNDTNVINYHHMDCIRCGIGLAATSFYPPTSSCTVNQISGIGLLIGQDHNSACLGGDFRGCYLESNNEDVVLLGRPLAGTFYGRIASEYALNLSKCLAVTTPRNADNSFRSDYETWNNFSVSYKGKWHQHEKTGRNNTDGSSYVVTVDRPGITRVIRSNAPDIIVIPLDLQLNRLFGYDSALVVVYGTGTNNAPTGTVTFRKPDGWTVNTLSADATFTTFTGPVEFIVYFRVAALDLEVIRR